VSLEAILAAIEASGTAEVARQRAQTEARVQAILAEAAASAEARREAARRAARRWAPGAHSRQRHQAQLEALRAAGAARDQLIDAVLAEVRRRLANLRADPSYPDILRRLAQEAVEVLGDEAARAGPPRLEVDPRDEALLHSMLGMLGAQVAVTPSLSGWGGVIARSGCDRIVATNTLEARFERAAPFLRSDLAAFFDRALSVASPPAARPSTLEHAPAAEAA
jgi:V/A-type H+-transporting ATPase subunit E